MEVLEQTLDSREVAKMVGRNHKEVLRDIRNLIEQMTSAKLQPVNISNYFIESSYKDTKGEYRPCFQTTKKGCELYSSRMTGVKGTHFVIAYIERFNDMESHIKQQEQFPQSPRAQLKLMFDFQEETAERVDAIEDGLNDIKENQLLCEPDYSTISKMVRRKVNIISEEQHLNNKHKKELFVDLNGSIKKITGVVARNRIKAKDFDKVVEFINNWQPSTATMTIIKQMKLDDE